VIPIKILFPSRLRVEKIRLTGKYKGKKCNIILLSDFHWDANPRTDEKTMNDVIQRTNELQPDIILLTGDYVQKDANPIKELTEKFFSRFQSRYGVYAVLGNHDYKRDPKLIATSLEKIGIRVLTNDFIRPCEGIELYGVGDFESKEFIPEKAFSKSQSKNTLEIFDKPKSKIEEEKPVFRIMMSHNPDSANILSKYPIDLIVSGHYHGGQVCVPVYDSEWKFKPIIPALVSAIAKIGIFLPGKVKRKLGTIVKNWDWRTGGPHKINETVQLYTSRGLATHPPLRLFCDPEITLIELE